MKIAFIFMLMCQMAFAQESTLNNLGLPDPEVPVTDEERETMSAHYASTPGSACYDQCKERKMLWVGPTREGSERASCNRCIDEQHARSLEALLVNPTHNVAFDPFSCEQTGPVLIRAESPCFNSCKPRRQVLNLVGNRGSQESSCERDACVACLYRNPEAYGQSTQRGVSPDCVLANDRLTVTCGQETYVLDRSINQVSRSITDQLNSQRHVPSPPPYKAKAQ